MSLRRAVGINMELWYVKKKKWRFEMKSERMQHIRNPRNSINGR